MPTGMENLTNDDKKCLKISKESLYVDHGAWKVNKQTKTEVI